MDALRMLVIENDAVIALLLAEVLAGMGHEVCANVPNLMRAIEGADALVLKAGGGEGGADGYVIRDEHGTEMAHRWTSSI